MYFNLWYVVISGTSPSRECMSIREMRGKSSKDSTATSRLILFKCMIAWVILGVLKLD